MAIFSSTKANIGSLSTEEWEIFEASAERMGSAIVSYLRSIVGDVHSIIDSQQSSRDGVHYETMFGRTKSRDAARNSDSAEERGRDFKFQDQKVPILPHHKGCQIGTFLISFQF